MTKNLRCFTRKLFRYFLKTDIKWITVLNKTMLPNLFVIFLMMQQVSGYIFRVQNEIL